jgi:phosphocarrier protein
MAEQLLKVTSESGVHARPATMLINKASQYSSDLTIESNGKHANLKSIMGVMAMGIQQGAVVKVTARGSDEEDALTGIAEVFISEGLCEKQ